MPKKKAPSGPNPNGRAGKAQTHLPNSLMRIKADLTQVFGGQLPRPTRVDSVPVGGAAPHTDPITPHIFALITSAPEPIHDETMLISFFENRPVGLSKEHATDEDIAELAPMLAEAAALARKRKVSNVEFTRWCLWAVIEALRERVFGTFLRIPGVTAPEDVKILATLAAAASRAYDRKLCPGVYAELASYAWLLPSR